MTSIKPVRIPNTEIWKSAQNGPEFGDIVASRNIDLQQDGRAKLSRKAMGLFSYGLSYDVLAAVDPGVQGTFLAACTGIGDGTGGNTDSFLYWISLTNAYTTQLNYYGTYTGVQFSATNAPTIGVDSDIVMFQGKPHVSGGQYVSDMAIGISETWNAHRITGLTTGVPHPLCVIEQLDQFAVGNGNKVVAYDTSYSAQYTLTIPSEYVVTTMRWRQNNLYIGTRHINGGEAKLFIWNGSGTAAQYGYGCGADWIYSLCDYQGRMHIITSAGQIRSYNGGGFDNVANFPVFYSPYSWTTTNSKDHTFGRVANRGMTSHGSFLYINIDGSVNSTEGVLPGTFLPDQPSGLWQYSPSSGLSHKAAVNFESRLRLTPSSLASSNLVFSTEHQAQTGDAIHLSSGSLTGVNDGQIYYVVVNSSTSFGLALSPADAQAGRTISIGGTVDSVVLMLDRYETFGSRVVSNPGAVISLGGTTISPMYGTEVIFGAGIYDSSYGITKASVCSLGMGYNRGSFTTARIAAGGLMDTVSRVAAFVDQLTLDSDQIIVKYRNVRRPSMPSALAFSGTGATWTSGTTFTVDSTQKDVKSIQVGDEIECVSGANAGYTCHVVSIDNSAPTYIFTVDETMPSSSGTFDFIADNWKKGPSFDRTSLTELKSGFQAALEGVSGNWTQAKIEIRGHDVAMQELIFSRNPTQ